MDILARLEVEVRALVDSNRDLRDRLERVEAECAALEVENQTMRHALAAEKAVREQALARLDALTGRLEGHLGAERLS
ncbi:MAG: cell division protein ZapB [Desulfovibrionaceae bacterium]|nr:cell division protein ZapB [Desulfovibrionaceae bacterium]